MFHFKFKVEVYTVDVINNICIEPIMLKFIKWYSGIIIIHVSPPPFLHWIPWHWGNSTFSICFGYSSCFCHSCAFNSLVVYCRMGTYSVRVVFIFVTYVTYTYFSLAVIHNSIHFKRHHLLSRSFAHHLSQFTPFMIYKL